MIWNRGLVEQKSLSLILSKSNLSSCGEEAGSVAVLPDKKAWAYFIDPNSFVNTKHKASSWFVIYTSLETTWFAADYADCFLLVLSTATVAAMALKESMKLVSDFTPPSMQSSWLILLSTQVFSESKTPPQIKKLIIQHCRVSWLRRPSFLPKMSMSLRPPASNLWHSVKI